MSNAGPAVVTIVHGRKPHAPSFGSRQGFAASRPDVQTYEDRDCAIAAERLRKIAIALTPIAKSRANPEVIAIDHAWLRTGKRYRSCYFRFYILFYIFSSLPGLTWPPASSRESPLLT